MTRLPGSQPGFERILRDVVTQTSELSFVAHEMIKRILLPEAPLAAKAAMDLPGREVFPGGTLLNHGTLVGERGQQVNVIGHDDEVEHLVAISIKVQKAVGNEAGDPGLCENTRAMTRVKRLVPARGEAVVIFGQRFGQQLLQARLPALLQRVDAVQVKPAISFRPPAIEDIPGHGIHRAPGDENYASILRPVRQPPLGDEPFVRRIKESHVMKL